MAAFDAAGRLSWTSLLRRATLFTTHEEASKAVLAICSAEISRGLVSGRLERTINPETDEVLIVDQGGCQVRRCPIRFDQGIRSILGSVSDEVKSRSAFRRFVREEFAAAARSGSRHRHEAKFRIGDLTPGDEYRTPASSRTRQAQQLGSYRR